VRFAQKGSAIPHSCRYIGQEWKEAGKSMQGLKGYSFHSSFVLGFHGCDRSTGLSVLVGKKEHLHASANSYDWLGSGIYFWENDPARAMAWAKERHSRPAGRSRVRQPAILGAVIELGRCLDLLDAQNFDLVRDAYAGLKTFMKASGTPMPENHALPGRRDKCLRNLDCSVINYIHEMQKAQGRPPFDTVRAAFFEGKPLYEGGNFYDKNHIQICVCNRNCIKGYFRPIMLGIRGDR
jgi:hypothetical protein